MKFYSADPGTTADLSQPAGYPSLNGARILLVDDNVFNRQIALDMLDDAGCVTSLANNGLEALDLLATTTFACVLMDVQMPVMDGLQATRLIRLDPRLTGLPVLAMTASASGEDRERCRAAGMDDFIAKPIESALLCQVLARWLPGAAAVAEPATGARLPSLLPGDPRVIDLTILATLLSCDAAKVRKFALKFLHSTQDGFAEMETALAAGKVQRVRELGHRIKSAARAVGALGLAELCERLEHLPHATAEAEQAAARTMIAALWPLLAQISEHIMQDAWHAHKA